MGSLRFRRTIKVAPGIRLNINKRSVGLSAGIPGARVSINSDGRSTRSVGVPGTGLYYRSQTGPRRGAGRSPYAPSPTAAPARPGLFAPKGEKLLYKAVQTQDRQLVEEVANKYSALRLPARVIGGVMAATSEPSTAMWQLAEAWNASIDPARDPFLSRYGQAVIELSLEYKITVQVGIDRAGLGLVLATLYENAGKRAEAIAVLQQVSANPIARIDLARLYVDAGRPEDAIALTNGLTNVDDESALLLVFRARAFRLQRLFDAAHETLKEGLRSRSRLEEIRLLALRERASLNVARGKPREARRDLERILATHADYPGVRDELALLSPP